MDIEKLCPVITPEQFFAVDLRVGIISQVKEFPEARKPAFQIWVDFGPEVGTLKTSSQITVHYTPEVLVGRRVVGWVNAPKRQVGKFMSEFLLLGHYDENGAVVLLDPTQTARLGARIA